MSDAERPIARYPQGQPPGVGANGTPVAADEVVRVPRLTWPQRAALGALYHATMAQSPKHLGVRRDVLWRLQDMDYCYETSNGEWKILGAGEDAYEAWWEAHR